MVLNEIADAIRNKRVLEATYDGGRRVFEPHCCGYGSKGQALARVFQVSGFSRSGQTQGWKLWTVEKIIGLSDTGRTFSGPRDKYNPHGDPAIPRIVAKL